MSLNFVTTPLIGVRHGFVGRQGGVSAGIFESLNVGLGSSDDAEAVRENRRRAVEAVAPGAVLVTLHQVHSNIAVPVTAAFPDAERPHADAMVTATPGLALGILTADCAPILLCDAEAGVIGAAHSGWKGALNDIAGATVSAMEALGARRERIAAAIGPCIARASYEVDGGFRDRFTEQDAAHDGFFARGRGDRFQFDLEGFVAMRLAAAGVRQVAALGIDTCPDDGRWFSFRRKTHRGELDYGRQVSVISL
ncbi:laccase domain protein [Polymorphobacter glacialis]|uniref:Purine nucleoside phosphorylase n=1 Tax=Sandarakinorhabdus glacialis TaxID=1614636 RepID=A0A916ZY95_9SPHN|nr:peptidoglycan editing factor PgeF [Polymorphobacter glacialis]GGE18741.1 laccase domain protein [Polymorphobacter glacialis]